MASKAITLDDYRTVAPRGTVDFLLRLAERVRGRSFLHVNSTRAGGGVAEILSRLVPIITDLGIKARWEVIEGDPEFFTTTKAVHNALQRAAAIVIQKSTREGFGLTVAEAMWKGKPVVGGATGGITVQIQYGITGYTVNSVEGAAYRIRYLLSNPALMRRMGEAGREHVRRNFLITRHLRDYLSLLVHLTG